MDALLVVVVCVGASAFSVWLPFVLCRAVSKVWRKR